MVNPGDRIVNQNESTHRFEMVVNGGTAFLQYHRGSDFVSLMHTEVPKELEGQGIGSELAKAGLEFARASSLKVVPLCPFVVAYIRRHPEYLELVQEKYRSRVTAG
jgi:predicted GNAT family acetyltransferase